MSVAIETACQQIKRTANAMDDCAGPDATMDEVVALVEGVHCLLIESENKPKLYAIPQQHYLAACAALELAERSMRLAMLEEEKLNES